MKKKGFTLIELLAVIVILAIIALIATPIVMNVIENSKKGAAERSAENYLRAVETAIASERLDGPIEDGEYEVDSNGDLVLEKEDSTKIIIQVDVNGTLPEEGSIIVIVNGLVDKTSVTIVIGDYTVEENEAGNLEAIKNNEGGDTAAKLCRRVTSEEVTTGNVPAGNYAYGDEYICNLGDGVERIFFVLEDGDNTALTKGDGGRHFKHKKIGTTGLGEVSLIMNQNYTDEVVPNKIKWCDPNGANPNNHACNHDGLDASIQHIQEVFGNNVTINLPTFDQLYAVGNGHIWLYNYLKDTKNPVSDVYGYWTSTAGDNYEPYNNAWSEYYTGSPSARNVNGGTGSSVGLRPVITISKSQLD